MDATLNDARDLPKDRPGISPQLRLPGEDAELGTEAPRGPSVSASDRPASTTPHRGGRAALMSTAGIVFLIGAMGYMGYAQRAELVRVPAIHQVVAKVEAMIPHREVRTAVNVAPAAPQSHPMSTAPAANDAAGHEPSKAASGKPQPEAASPSQALAIEPAPGKVAALTPVPQSAVATQLQQFDAFKAATTIPASEAAHPAASAPTAKPPTPSTQKNLQAEAHTTTDKADAGAVLPSSIPKAASTTVSPAPATQVAAAGTIVEDQSPVHQALVLTAAPMTDQEQLQVLHLVTQLGALVRDQKREIASLHDQVATLSGHMDQQLTNFDRRLSLAEAKGEMDAAMGAANNAITEATNAGIESKSARHIAPSTPAQAPSAPALVRSVSDYSIQAASPGLAMLSTTTGDGSIQVAVGDTVPGVGHVVSIYQRGTSWVVKTDHGLIQ